MAGTSSFRYEVEKSAEPNSQGNMVTTMACRGRLLGENSNDVKELAKPLPPLGGRIVST